MIEHSTGGGYVAEAFTGEERAVLSQHFTNLDRPVFALVNLPEVVKGALFARYSRTHKSLRRLFLDEFAGDAAALAGAGGGEVGEAGRAEALYRKVFYEFGDDSVAQLGGAHVACEQVSNIATKVLEWHRLMAYLEQSTRYIAFDRRLGGRYRYHRPVEMRGDGRVAGLYEMEMDAMFADYGVAAAAVRGHLEAVLQPGEGDDPAAWRASLNARALDGVRGMLPAATTSNVGIFASGQAYETMLLRLAGHPLAEARALGEMILKELRKVIPAFVSRVDVAGRGADTSRYLADTRVGVEHAAGAVLASSSGGGGVSQDGGDAGEVTLVDFDPDGETKMVAAMLYPHTSLPESQILRRVEAMTTEQRLEVIGAYVGDRTNRRHRPGRAFERCYYRFDVLSDYGAFRDLQRHRMLTIQWQPLDVSHGYVMPAVISEAGVEGLYAQAMARSAQLYDELAGFGVGSYAAALAYRIRYVMQLNAREAMHMLELRTTPQGHPAYRRVAQQMHRLIDGCGHRAVAASMSYVDHSDDAPLGRLVAENRAAARRRSTAA